MPAAQNESGDMQYSSSTGVLLVPGEQGLTEVAGLALWQRLLLSGRKAGIHTWVVLAWRDAQRLRDALATDTRLQGLSCQVYDIADTLSLPASEVLPAEQVIVMACTAILDHQLLTKFQHLESVTLAVTPPPSHIAEGLVLQDGQIVAMSDEPASAYGSADLLSCPGALLASLIQQTWEPLQKTTAPFEVLLPDLIATTAVQAFEVTEPLWMPIGPPFARNVATAEAALLRRLGRQGDSFIVRQVNRRLSQALTKRLVRTAVTPNQITLFSALLGLSGAFLLAQPTYLAQVLGSLLFLCSTIIDGCDGEVARLTFQESDFGGKFDVMMDNVVHLFLFPGIAIGVYRETHNPLALVLGGLTLGGVMISMAAYVPALWRRSANRSSHTRLHESLASRDFAYLLLLLALFDRLEWFLWATAVGTYLFAGGWLMLSRIRSRRL
jgi:phosphatidylglycerophosphate synthase